MENPRKILIIRLSSIGDIILATPLIRCVRNKYPDARIDFLVKKQFLEIVANNPNLDNILVFEKGETLKGIKRQIKQEKYDWLIDIHQNFRSLYLKTWSGIPIKTGYSKKIFYRSLLVCFGINIYREIKPVLLRYFEAIEKQGITYDKAGTEVFVPLENVESVRRHILQSGYTPDKSLFVISPGASFANKRWIPENFSQVARHLINNRNGFVALIGGKNDKEVCAEIQRMAGPMSVNVAGEFSITDSAALLSLCDGFIGNDSGMLHLAQAFKKPVVGIYGPTVEELGYFPIQEKSIVVEKPIPCRPCTHNGLNNCPKKHFRCMKTISSDDAIFAIDQLLAK